MRGKKSILQIIKDAWNGIRYRSANQKIASINMISSYYWKDTYLKWMTESHRDYYRSRIENGDLEYLLIKAPEMELIRYLNENGYAAKLLSRSKQLVHKDYYGDNKIDSWISELDRFIDDRIFHLTRAAASYPQFLEHIAKAYSLEYLLDVDRDQLHTLVFDYISDLEFEDDNDFIVAEVKNGFEYEIAISNALSRLGWTVRMTGSGGDQGVDVLAERNGVLYAIQCKYYSTPVGNSAVQQVHAGAAYYGAPHSAVVSNAPYTKSAMQLADSLGVRLLHDRDLDQI